MSLDGLPNLRLPEAPGIRNAPTLRQRPDDADDSTARSFISLQRDRPHRALDLQPPDLTAVAPARGDPRSDRTAVHRRDLLGGIIHEYRLAA